MNIGVNQGKLLFVYWSLPPCMSRHAVLYSSRSVFFLMWIMLQVKIFLSRDREAYKFGDSTNSSLANH